MTARLDPLLSEFETDDHAKNYDRWFTAKVREAMSSAKPRIAHDEAMVRVDTLLAMKRSKPAGRPVD